MGRFTRREQSLRLDLSMGGLRFIVFQPGWDTRSQCFTLRRKMAFRLAQSQSLMTVQRAWYPSTHIVPRRPSSPLFIHRAPVLLLYTLSHLPPLTPATAILLCPENGIVEEPLKTGRIVAAFLLFTCNFARLRFLSRLLSVKSGRVNSWRRHNFFFELRLRYFRSI